MEALRLFREVAANFPLDERSLLDKQMLAEADQDYENKNFDDALRKYANLFFGWQKNSSKRR
jgi:hypothetical protein